MGRRSGGTWTGSDAAERADSRRQFLTRTGRGALGIACLSASPWISGCASFPRVSPLREGAIARIPLSAFETSRGVLFDYVEEGMPVYVHQHSAMRFSAVLTRCAHRGCEVEPNSDRIVCPCHGSEYRHDGGLLEGPAESPLISYPATVVGDFVRIDLAHASRAG
jgi:cytochrome b6-f complex iron-sulfur subunit